MVPTVPSVVTTVLILALFLAESQGGRHAEYLEIRGEEAPKPPPAQVKYEKHQLWKVYVNGSEGLQVIDDLEIKGLCVSWKFNSTDTDILIHPDNVEKVKTELVGKKLAYDVSIKDMQKAIDATTKKEPVMDRKKGHAMDWKVYHKLTTIEGYLNALAQMHPQICSLQSIGQTAEGRQILLFKIQNGTAKNKKRIWLDGGMHAREWISPAAVTYIIEQIVQHHLQAGPSPVKNVDWCIVPMLNPDGYEYSYTYNRLWRKNRSKAKSKDDANDTCVGVDLNRNFGFLWNLEIGTSRNPCSGMYRGPAAFSEAETAAVAKYFINHPGHNYTWVGFISVHSYGQQIVYPWASRDLTVEMKDEVHNIAMKAAQAVKNSTKTVYTVGPMGHVIYGASGTSTDWARGSASIKYSFVLELQDEGRFAFVLPNNMILGAVKEAYTIVESLAESIDADGSLLVDDVK